MKRAAEEEERVAEPAVKKQKALSSAKELKDELVGSITDEGWREALKGEFSQPYFQRICDALFKEYASGAEIFPPRHQIFNALNFTPLKNVRCVIIGQDPYHDFGQAHGLCFSVVKGVAAPPSLKNIYTELASDIPGFQAPPHGCLEAWARNGVLLLNATLTVRAHTANSHKDVGWQQFTSAVIREVNRQCKHVVFINWGLFAQKKCKDVDAKKHCLLNAAHPSPLSVTKFRGCKVFSKANDYLKSVGLTPIDWTLPRSI